MGSVMSTFGSQERKLGFLKMTRITTSVVVGEQMIHVVITCPARPVSMLAFNLEICAAFVGIIDFPVVLHPQNWRSCGRKYFRE